MSARYNPLPLLRLLVRFLRALLISGLETLQVILAHSLGRRPPASRLVLMPYAPLTPTGAALYASLISLTPGTTVIHIDSEHHQMLLHVLDTTHPEALIAALRQLFEADLVRYFGVDHA
jgi:multisubunit Na+/H+ antiporter MnhE subunit